jgi:hypothetical protein
MLQTRYGSRRAGSLTTIVLAVGLMLDLASGANAQSSAGDQQPDRSPGIRVALDQKPIAAGERRQPVSTDIDRPPRPAAGGPRLRNLDGELQQLYDQVMRASAPPLSTMR